ncbi:unnamed protein product [Heterobilharzia americana]|nr:unnamed protein product [Heterobilharzia americana]CAH8470753.1 unnamed protein product [Heterobilharzia americana]
MDCCNDVQQAENKGRTFLELLDALCNHEATDSFEPSVVSDQIVKVVNSASKRRLGKLDTFTVLEYLCSKHVPPVSLLTALIFIEKLAVTNPHSSLLTEVTAFDLFAVSMVVASKYLHDDDTDYGMYNAEWANEFDMDLKELNDLEIKFLSALNWEFFVTKAQILKFGFEIGVFSQTTLYSASSDKSDFTIPLLSRITRTLFTCMSYFTYHKIRIVSKVVFILAVAYMGMNKYPQCSFEDKCPDPNQTRFSSLVVNECPSNKSSNGTQLSIPIDQISWSMCILPV